MYQYGVSQNNINIKPSQSNSFNRVLADKMGISDLDQVKKWVEKASLNAKVENDKVKVIVSSSSVHEQLSEKMNQLLSLNNHVNSVCSQEN